MPLLFEIHVLQKRRQFLPIRFMYLFWTRVETSTDRSGVQISDRGNCNHFTLNINLWKYAGSIEGRCEGEKNHLCQTTIVIKLKFNEFRLKRQNLKIAKVAELDLLVKIVKFQKVSFYNWLNRQNFPLFCHFDKLVNLGKMSFFITLPFNEMLKVHKMTIFWNLPFWRIVSSRQNDNVPNSAIVTNLSNPKLQIPCHFDKLIEVVKMSFFLNCHFIDMVLFYFTRLFYASVVSFTDFREEWGNPWVPCVTRYSQIDTWLDRLSQNDIFFLTCALLTNCFNSPIWKFYKFMIRRVDLYW